MQLHFTPDALKSIATRARGSNTGARGLRTIVEEVLLESMYRLPTWAAQGVRHAVVSEAVVGGYGLPELYPLPQGEGDPVADEDPDRDPPRARRVGLSVSRVIDHRRAHGYRARLFLLCALLSRY